MDPSAVRQMIIDNYGGVRVDGTNATIIGNAQGEFIADRNHITRVWMDHAFWPFVTTKFYIDQTGDLEILFEKVPYFKDLQSKRGTDHDTGWDETYGKCQRTEGGVVYFEVYWNICFFRISVHSTMSVRTMRCGCTGQTGMTRWIWHGKMEKAWHLQVLMREI